MCLANQLEFLYRAASKVLREYLFSTLIPLLFTETKLPVLKITLKHQVLSCFGRALCLLPESLNLSAIGSKSVISRLKKKPSLWSYCLSTEETLLSLREPFIICWIGVFGIEIGLKRYRYTILWKVAKAIPISIQKYRAIRIADTCISILPISVYYVTVKFASAIRKIWVKRYRYTILWKVAKAIPISIQKYRAIRIADTCISILPISVHT